MQCGAQLMFDSFVMVFSKLLGSILQCDVQLSWVEFCIVVHVSNKRILLHLIHGKHIQLLYFLVLNHAWFG